METNCLSRTLAERHDMGIEAAKQCVWEYENTFREQGGVRD